jgi:hypothetical protein
MLHKRGLTSIPNLLTMKSMKLEEKPNLPELKK